MRGVNLIPAYRIEARRRADRVRMWATGCGVYSVVLIGAWGVAQIVWPDSRVAVAGDIASFTSRAEADQAAARAMHPQLLQAQSTLAATQSIGDQPDWSHLASLLSQLLGDDAVLRTCRLQPAPQDKQEADDSTDAGRISRYFVHVEGFGRSQAAVLAYVRAIEETRLFDRVTLIETRGEAFYSGQAIGFRIECVLVDGPPGATP